MTGASIDPNGIAAATPGVVVGAENLEGTSGNQLAGAPTGDLKVVLGSRQAGILTYSYTVQGAATGTGEAKTSMTVSPVLFRGDRHRRRSGHRDRKLTPIVRGSRRAPDFLFLSPFGQWLREPDLSVDGVVCVDLKFLLAALFVVVSPPEAVAPADPVELGFPNVAVAIGEARHSWVEVKTSEPEPDADVVMRFDATGIASMAKVTTATEGCVTAANVITCYRKMNVDRGEGSVALVFVTGRGQAGTGRITITASVNGVSFGPVHSTVTVVHPPKLILLGTKVKAAGQTKVEVMVGLKNVGKGTFDPGPIGPNINSVTHYITFDAWVQPLAGHCFSWGPYPDGWDWEHPNRPSYRFACASGRIEAGATSLYKLVVTIDPKRPLVNGYIAFHNLELGTEHVPIVIDTWPGQETLPKTGPRVGT
ncbi:MAG TPA: hypothetical protein VFC19_11325 [Candidatus Limnocylindrales bacterium]|nr:hypothetical protein [Candidatus Limnocylindrales bacterium]